MSVNTNETKPFILISIPQELPHWFTQTTWEFKTCHESWWSYGLLTALLQAFIWTPL